MRFTISLEDKLGERFDQFIQDRGYKNRSEAVRDLIREKLEAESLVNEDDSDCVGTLTYIYNPEERDLARRLASAQHQSHNLCISTSYVLLDHDNRMETVVLRGKVKEVSVFAEKITSQPGVRHGQIYIVPVMIDRAVHTHDEGSSSTHAHTHVTPHS
jgi:CopG family nickel-responsive transcriptional regulator